MYEIQFLKFIATASALRKDLDEMSNSRDMHLKRHVATEHPTEKKNDGKNRSLKTRKLIMFSLSSCQLV